MLHLHTINRQRLEEIIRLKKALQAKGGSLSASQRPSTVSGLSGGTPSEEDDVSKRLMEYGREVAVLRNTNRNVCQVLKKLHGTLKGCREGLRKLRDTAQSTKDTIQRHVDAAFDSFAYDLRVMFVVHRIGSRTEKENLGTRVLILESEVDVLGHRLEKSQKEVERLKERDAEQIQTIDWMQGKIDTLKMQLKEYEARFLSQAVANDKMKVEIGTLRSSVAHSASVEAQNDGAIVASEKARQSPNPASDIGTSSAKPIAPSEPETEPRLPKPPTLKPQSTASNASAAQPTNHVLTQRRSSRPQFGPRSKTDATTSSKPPPAPATLQHAAPEENAAPSVVPPQTGTQLNTPAPTHSTSNPSAAVVASSTDLGTSERTQLTAAEAVRDLTQQLDLFRITYPTKASTLANALYQQLDRLGYGTSAPVKSMPASSNPRRNEAVRKHESEKASFSVADPTPESEPDIASDSARSRRGTSGKIAALIDTMTGSLSERHTAELSDTWEDAEGEPEKSGRKLARPRPPAPTHDPVAEVVARILSLHEKWLMKWSARREELVRAEEHHYLGLLELSERSARSETVTTHINLDLAELSGLHTSAPTSATKSRPSTGRSGHAQASQHAATSNWTTLLQEARYYSAFAHKYKYHWASVPSLQFDIVPPARLPLWTQSPRGDIDPELPTFRQITK